MIKTIDFFLEIGINVMIVYITVSSKENICYIGPKNWQYCLMQAL